MNSLEQKMFYHMKHWDYNGICMVFQWDQNGSSMEIIVEEEWLQMFFLIPTGQEDASEDALDEAPSYPRPMQGARDPEI